MTRWTTVLVTATAVCAGDLIANALLRLNLAPCPSDVSLPCPRIHVLGPIAFYRLTNHGSPVSGDAASLWVWPVLGAGAIIFAILCLRVAPDTRALQVAVGLIIGGASANLFERLFLGGVTDFINVSVTSTLFNIADLALLVGCVWCTVILYQRLFRNQRGQRQRSSV